MIIKKDDAEAYLGHAITDRQFKEALQKAIKKQVHIYRVVKDPEVMRSWYLAVLTAEYVDDAAFSETTLEIGRKILNMEKEHPTKCQGAQTHYLYCNRSCKINQV